MYRGAHRNSLVAIRETVFQLAGKNSLDIFPVMSEAKWLYCDGIRFDHDNVVEFGWPRACIYKQFIFWC
jgi:hypothetical protein